MLVWLSYFMFAYLHNTLKIRSVSWKDQRVIIVEALNSAMTTCEASMDWLWYVSSNTVFLSHVTFALWMANAFTTRI